MQFNSDGMEITQNAGYLDVAKSFDTRKKFIDKYMGVRLIDRNTQRLNIISLYLTDTSKRKSYR